MNDSETADEDRNRVEGCYKLLLDAGSDLSSVETYYDDRTVSAFSSALMYGTLVRRSCCDLVSRSS